MTELGKDQHLLPHYGNCVILAHLGTALAVGAFLQVHLRDHLAYISALFDNGMKEESRIRLFHVAVQEQWISRIRRS
jgi:hypothetical protein